MRCALDAESSLRRARRSAATAGSRGRRRASAGGHARGAATRSPAAARQLEPSGTLPSRALAGSRARRARLAKPACEGALQARLRRRRRRARSSPRTAPRLNGSTPVPASAPNSTALITLPVCFGGLRHVEADEALRRALGVRRAARALSTRPSPIALFSAIE